MGPLLEHFVSAQSQASASRCSARLGSARLGSARVSNCQQGSVRSLLTLLCMPLPCSLPLPYLLSVQAYSMLDSLVLELFPDLTHALGR